MKFVETTLRGAYIIELEKHTDERGFFARSWDTQEFARKGLDPKIVQCSVSLNEKRGTLRGMHYQSAPFQEAKIVRCTRGTIYDVIIDIRHGSETFMQWTAAELTEDNHRMLYVPKGFAHGFQTLVDHSEVFYQISETYSPGSARGIRWNDPQFKITWPDAVRTMSVKDSECPDFDPTNAEQV